MNSRDTIWRVVAASDRQLAHRLDALLAAYEAAKNCRTPATSADRTTHPSTTVRDDYGYVSDSALYSYHPRMGASSRPTNTDQRPGPILIVDDFRDGREV
jgi:hypothetical protein